MIRSALSVVRRAVGGLALRAAQILGMSAELYAGLGGYRSVGSSVAGVVVDSDTALKVSAYKRGVELIANYIGKTPFHVKKANKKAKSHVAWKLVRKWAQHHQLSAFEFRRTVNLLALTRGNGYGYIVRDPASAEPLELHVLDPSRVTPILRRGRLWYQFDTQATLRPASDVIHIRGISKNGYLGLDPIKTYAVDVLGLSIAQNNYAGAYYSSGGVPSVYLHSDVPLSDDHFNRLKGETGPLKRSIDNPHEIPVIDGAELKSTNLTAEQTQLLGSREFGLKDIANILNLTVHKLNGEGTGGYKSVEEENNAFRDDTLDPWFVQWEIEYEKLLTEAEQETESHSVEAVRQSLTRSNMADRAGYLTKAVGGPWMTAGEARDVDSLEELPDLDKVYPPSNMTREEKPAAGDDPAPDPPEPPKRARSVSNTLLQVAALEDVAGRMVKRLTVAARKAAERSALFPDFLEGLPANHSRTVRSAFAPVVALCGGGGDSVADELVNDFRVRMSSVYDSAPAERFAGAVAEACDVFERSAGLVARKAVESWTH